jgi:imidazoleglycerol-phosphate dehydratase
MSSSQPAPRWAAFARDTNETKIQIAINLDGGALPPDTDPRLLEATTGHASESGARTIHINTGIGFLDHMLHALAKHAGWSLAINCKGDLHSPFSPLFSFPHTQPGGHLRHAIP